MNSLMIVGRLVRDIEITQLESGKEVSSVTIAVNRSFKNQDGTYDTDFIDCILWDGLAQNVHEYCHKGDLIGIRGRLQTSTYEKDKIKHKVHEVIVEKISFLAKKLEKEAE